MLRAGEDAAQICRRAGRTGDFDLERLVGRQIARGVGHVEREEVRRGGAAVLAISDQAAIDLRLRECRRRRAIEQQRSIGWLRQNGVSHRRGRADVVGKLQEAFRDSRGGANRKRERAVVNFAGRGCVSRANN